MRACLQMLPSRHHAVVAGTPDDEGNSVEVVRKLARRLPVYWLVTDDSATLEWLLSGVDGAETVRCLPKYSVRAFWAYATARYVFFTHGLYGSPYPPRNKTSVNLWHGDGPKRRNQFARIRSTVVVSGTRLWGRYKADEFEVGQDDLLVTGNPRVDQFSRPITDDGLRALGLDPSDGLVLWLPTFRTTDFQGRRLGPVRNWSDAAELSNSPLVRSRLGQVAEAARSKGVTLAVKPHPLDADRFSDTGLHIVTGADLREARVTFYQLLARADGLITDYSSVWTDFLALDRPIGFYCPDHDDYVAARGLNVDDYFSLLPGPLLQDGNDFQAFVRECVEEPELSQARRLRSADLIGAETRLGATERLLDAVGIVLPHANAQELGVR